MISNFTRYLGMVLIHVPLLGFTCMQIAFAAESADSGARKVDVNGTVSMITTNDRNISVSNGSDGLLIIEDKNTPLSTEIYELLGLLGSDRSAFIIDTHFDSGPVNSADHPRNSGAIIAQETIQDRLESNKKEPKPRPIIAYERELKVYFNDEKISIIHLSADQTLNQSIVLFGTSNVAYLGHQFWNRQFPFIDLEQGETLRGYLLAVAECLSLVNSSMKIIPGQGPLATITDLQNFYRMLNMTSITVKKQMDKGLSREQIIAHGLGDEWKSWGEAQVDEPSWINILYTSQLE